jgi:hypothetical protein
VLGQILIPAGLKVVAFYTRLDVFPGHADFDLAILDADLNGQPASPVADALVTRGTPFVFATGYGSVPEPYRGRPMLTKPFQIDGLKQMLQSALA